MVHLEDSHKYGDSLLATSRLCGGVPSFENSASNLVIDITDRTITENMNDVIYYLLTRIKLA